MNDWTYGSRSLSLFHGQAFGNAEQWEEAVESSALEPQLSRAGIVTDRLFGS